MPSNNSKNGANLIVGAIICAVSLWFFYSRSFGTEMALAITSVGPDSWQQAVEVKRQTQLAHDAFLMTGNPDALKVAEPLRGGVISGFLQIVAVLLENGLPVVIDLVSAVGAAAIGVWGFARTFVIDEVAGLLGFTTKVFTKDSEDLKVAIDKRKSNELILNTNQKRLGEAQGNQEAEIQSIRESIKAIHARIEAVDNQLDEKALRSFLGDLEEKVSRNAADVSFLRSTVENFSKATITESQA